MVLIFFFIIVTNKRFFNAGYGVLQYLGLLLMQTWHTHTFTLIHTLAHTLTHRQGAVEREAGRHRLVLFSHQYLHHRSVLSFCVQSQTEDRQRFFYILICADFVLESFDLRRRDDKIGLMQDRNSTVSRCNLFKKTVSIPKLLEGVSLFVLVHAKPTTTSNFTKILQIHDTMFCNIELYHVGFFRPLCFKLFKLFLQLCWYL